MKRTTFQISINKRDDNGRRHVARQECQGYSIGVPGLVIHRAVVRHGRGDWTVSHEYSGWSVCPLPYRLRADAAAFASEIADLTDWTQDRDTIGSQWQTLQPAVLSAARHARSRAAAD